MLDNTVEFISVIVFMFCAMLKLKSALNLPIFIKRRVFTNNSHPSFLIEPAFFHSRELKSDDDGIPTPDIRRSLVFLPYTSTLTDNLSSNKPRLNPKFHESVVSHLRSVSLRFDGDNAEISVPPNP